MNDLAKDNNKNIWDGDLLGRKEEGLHLQRFIENTFKLENSSKSPSSFVLNINSSWGQGKTWFLTRLAKQLGQNHTVVYFDAWKNDFTKDALLSFVSIICDELSKRFSRKRGVKAKIEKIKTVFSAVSKSAVPIVAAAVAKQLLGQQINGFNFTESQKDIFTDATDQLANVVSQSAVDAFVTQKNAIEDFSEAIASLVDEIAKSQDLNLPICIMIDELDRCRPTYSIELLEAVKHLFAIRGMFFIIATDTKQLSHSIKAVYGNGFDAAAYLKRFFYAEFNLTRPDGLKLSKALFANELLESQLFISDSIKSNYTVDILFTFICDFFDLNVRDREQVFSILKTFVFSYGKSVDFIFLMLLICFKKVDVDRYDYSSRMRNLDAFHEYFKETRSTRVDQVLKLSYLKKEGRMISYGAAQQDCHLIHVFIFYTSLLKINIDDALDECDEQSHYVYQPQVYRYFLSVNDVFSYFSLIDQAGHISIN